MRLPCSSFKFDSVVFLGHPGDDSHNFFAVRRIGVVIENQCHAVRADGRGILQKRKHGTQFEGVIRVKLLRDYSAYVSGGVLDDLV